MKLIYGVIWGVIQLVNKWTYLHTRCEISLLFIILDYSLGLPHILLLFVIDPHNPFYCHKSHPSLKKNNRWQTLEENYPMRWYFAFNPNYRGSMTKWLSSWTWNPLIPSSKSTLKSPNLNLLQVISGSTLHLHLYINPLVCLLPVKTLHLLSLPYLPVDNAHFFPTEKASKIEMRIIDGILCFRLASLLACKQIHKICPYTIVCF